MKDWFKNEGGGRDVLCRQAGGGRQTVSIGFKL